MSEELTASMRETIRSAAKKLTGARRREFQAEVAVREQLAKDDCDEDSPLPAVRTAGDMLNRLGYRLRRVRKTRPQRTFPRRTTALRTSDKCTHKPPTTRTRCGFQSTPRPRCSLFTGPVFGVHLSPRAATFVTKVEMTSARRETCVRQRRGVKAETRPSTFLGDVRKLVKPPTSMGFPVDAVRLENSGVWFF
jgi:hypothetical protein